jgi:hypothetical protein
MATDWHYPETVLKHYFPKLVIIESCALVGWVHEPFTHRYVRKAKKPRLSTDFGQSERQVTNLI